MAVTAHEMADAGLPERAELVRNLRYVNELATITAVEGPVLAEAADLLARAADLLAARRGVAAWLPSLIPAQDRRQTPQQWWHEWNSVVPPVTMTMVDREFTASVTFPAQFHGPPGHVHGGHLAAAIDHVLGLYVHAIGRTSHTARLTVNYRKPVEIGVPTTIAVGVAGTQGRKTEVWATLAVDGEAHVEAEGLFVLISDGEAGRAEPSAETR